MRGVIKTALAAVTVLSLGGPVRASVPTPPLGSNPTLTNPTIQGVTKSPYVTPAQTTGIASGITGFGTTGGLLNLAPGPYNLTACQTIDQPGIAVQGAAMGFNVDPNGQSEGGFGTKIHLGTAGQCGFQIGSNSGRVQGLSFDKLYVWGTGIADGSKGINAVGTGGLDQARFSNMLISNVQYGFYIDEFLDAPYMFGVSVLGAGYGMYVTAANGQMAGAQLVGLELADNSNGGYTDLSTGGGAQINNGLFWRNASTLTTNGSNITLSANFGHVTGAHLANPGLNLLNSTQVAADNFRIAGQSNIIANNIVRGAASGCGVHLTGAARYNLIANNFFTGNTNGAACDIKLDSGALQNSIFSPSPTSIQDNSGQDNYKFYLDDATRSYILKTNPTGDYASLIIQGSANTPYLTGFELDASAQTGGHKWLMQATSGGNGFGQGGWAVQDKTGGGTYAFGCNNGGSNPKCYAGGTLIAGGLAQNSPCSSLTVGTCIGWWNGTLNGRVGVPTGATLSLQVNDTDGVFMDTYGRIRTAAAITGVPTIANNACGSATQGTITAGGSDQDFILNVGTAAVTSCTVSFAHTWTTAPRVCVFSPANAAAAATGTTVAYGGTPSTTAWVLNGSALASASYQVHCS